MGLSPSDLQGARESVDSFLPNSCHNHRTGEQLPCRLIRFSTQERRFEGAPRFLWQPQWKVILRDGANVRGWDRLTIGSKQLTVTGVVTSGSYSLTTEAYAQEIGLYTVRFRQQQTAVETDPVDIIILSSSTMAQLDPQALQFQYRAIWDDTICFSNTQQPQISLSDFIIWDKLAEGQDRLNLVTRNITPFPWAQAFFVERQ